MQRSGQLALPLIGNQATNAFLEDFRSYHGRDVCWITMQVQLNDVSAHKSASETMYDIQSRTRRTTNRFLVRYTPRQ